MSKRDHLRACEARRDAILRAHECDATPTDGKVLQAVFWYLSEWDTISDVVRLDNLAAVTFAIMPSEVQRWHRNRVSESLRRWDGWGIVSARARRGRPAKDGGGPVVEIALIEVAERHPVSRVLYRDIKHPQAGVTFEQEKHPAQRNKEPRSDEKSTPISEEKHPTPTLKTCTSFRKTVRKFLRKAPRFWDRGGF